MQLKNQETTQAMIQRLKRIEGQIRGVQNMLVEGRDCKEIMQQFSAIRSALHHASLVFLEEYATECLAEQADNSPQNREKLVKDLFVMVNQLD